MTARPFRPYGTPPSFDLDEYKDSFDLWKAQWDIFIELSTVDTALDEAERPKYKANLLKSCMSKQTLAAVLSSGMSADDLKNPDKILVKLRERCNAGRNRHVWRQQFASRVQRENEAIDDWLCDLRTLSTKSEFKEDCCDRCEPTRILGQVVFGVYSDDDRRKLLEKGPTLTLDDALITLRTSEAAAKQSTTLKPGEASSIQQMAKSAYKKQKPKKASSAAVPNKEPSRATKHKHAKNPDGCWNCGGKSRHEKKECPAAGKECHSCGRTGHFSSVCKSKDKPKAASLNTIRLRTTALNKVAAVTAAEMVKIVIAPKVGSSAAAHVSCLPDTGAELDAIPRAVYKRFFKNVDLYPAPSPVTAVGSPIINDGTFRASLDWHANDNKRRPVETTVHVLRNLKQAVLSKSTQQKLGMLPDSYPHVRVNHVAAKVVEEVMAPGKESHPAGSSHPAVPSSVFFPHLIARALPDTNVIAALCPSPASEEKTKDLQQLMAEFPVIFDGRCRPMKGPPCHFELKEDATPVAMRGSRPVAVPLMPRLREELDSLEEEGLICKVTEPTAWVHPIVIAPKKNGGIRLCVDFRNLNESIIRPRFETQTPFQAVRTIPKGMRYFTVIDALKGYHQVPLDEESSNLTTFSTPFGRYRYLRLPFGIKHAGDDYSRRVSDVFDDIPNSRRVVEDVIVFSATYADHVDLVRQLFSRAAEHNVALNVQKLVFAQPSVLFGGFIVDAEGFKPDPDLTRAIAEFPTPLNITDLRAFFGLCQQIGNFTDEISSALVPLSQLLKKDLAFEWTSTHDDAFQTARKVLSTHHSLAFYDPALPTSLHVDASRLNGLGFLLKQKRTDGEWKVVQAGSRFLSSAESRYAMIELECLAAAWAMHKCRQFIEGLPTFELVTDHKPLIPILNSYALDKLDNPRLLRLRLKMQRYAFTARWIPGKENQGADALSRAPISAATPDDEMAEGTTFVPPRLALLCAIDGSDPKVLDPVLEKIKLAASLDPVMKTLRTVILEGFPNEKCNLQPALRPFWRVRHQLAVDDIDDMIVMGARVVIPKILQGDILRDLLKMHQGATKLRQRARLSVFWPNMDAEIFNMARSCDECIKKLPSHPPEPLRPHEPATRPFEQVHGDLGSINGRHFIVLVDQYSGWPHVAAFPDASTSSKRVINAVRDFFINVGVPVKFWSDNGPQFSAAEFRRFLEEWGVTHGTSSPHYPQSNGVAEAGVKEMKKLIAGSWTAGSFDLDKFGQGLLLFRNTPRHGGQSPAQMVFQRPIRDCLPAHRRSFASEWQKQADVLEKRARRSRELRTEHFNRRAHPLPPLVVGNHVLIQHPVSKCWATPGVIVETGPNRDYLVKTPAGRIFRRNRRFLRRRIPVMPSTVAPPAALGAPIPIPATDPGPLDLQEEAVPLRRSSRQRKPSTMYPSHSWTK